jgi:hypothetical protein
MNNPETLETSDRKHRQTTNTKKKKLNQHFYSKNIVDSPLCQCGAIETTEHYLLYCPLYNVHRQLFIEHFFDDPLISYHHYPFGLPEFSYEQNVEIFLAVQSFIINSKRFNRN